MAEQTAVQKATDALTRGAEFGAARDEEAAPGAYAEYDWSEFHPGQKVDFIQTGSQYVGSDIVDMTQASPGIGSEAIYQDNYVATGYYKRETDGRVLKITVDERGTILATTVFGTTCK